MHAHMAKSITVQAVILQVRPGVHICDACNSTLHMSCARRAALKARCCCSAAQMSGTAVYSKLKYESGVHRVQRVPQTETQGRVHTSTATVRSAAT